MKGEDDVLSPGARSSLLFQAIPHVWGAAFVANLERGRDVAVACADAAVDALEQVRRSPPTALETIAAKSGQDISEQDFRGWYRICDGLRKGPIEARRTPATEQEIEDAYHAYSRARGDFF
jgi:hypothetical protein